MGRGVGFVVLLAMSVCACGDGGNSKTPMKAVGGAGGAGNSSGSSSTGGQPSITGGAPAQDAACGLASAAYCETFEDGPVTPEARGGDLDEARISAARLAPLQMADGDQINWIGPATIPLCRDGVGPTVWPPEDTLICQPNTQVGSGHLLTAVAAQNYGLNSFRILQPFDFADRTGTIVFDADLSMPNGLFGWASIEITDEPIPAPSFTNYERGPLPRNAIQIHFDYDRCSGKTAVGHALTYDDYVATELKNDLGEFPPCIVTEKDSLNRAQIRLSQTKVEVYASDFSEDGLTFAKPQLIFSAPLSLNFTRGWVHFTTRNHATIKYGFGDSWTIRWDNIGFDGPKLSAGREYQIPDSSTPAQSKEGKDGVNMGYRLAEAPGGMLTCCPTTAVPSLTFEDVDLTGVKKATLAFNSYYLNNVAPVVGFTLLYSFNGGEFIERPMTEGEVKAITTELALGSMAQTIDVPLSALVDGTNTLEFYTRNVPLNYPPSISNIDLILTTE
jgi:hypothetical protein